MSAAIYCRSRRLATANKGSISFSQLSWPRIACGNLGQPGNHKGSAVFAEDNSLFVTGSEMKMVKVGDDARPGLALRDVASLPCFPLQIKLNNPLSGRV
jgi:hypothetical protein